MTNQAGSPRAPLWVLCSGVCFYGLLIPFFGSLFIERSIPEWHWEHVPFHAVIEGVGGTLALVMASFWWISGKADSTRSPFFWLTCGLISMGILHFFHAMAPLGPWFVWLHSVANFSGGLFFGMIFWLHRFPFDEQTQRWFGLALVALLSLVALSFTLFTHVESFPMIGDVSFTWMAQTLNGLGEMGFFMAAFFFSKHYLNNRDREHYLLAMFCTLLGTAGVLFEWSVLWYGTWWWWHVIRFAAYSVLFGVVLGNNQLSYRELQRRSQAVLDTAVDAIITIDQRGIVESINPAGEHLTGYTANEVIGQNVSMLMPAPYATEHNGYLDHYLATRIKKIIGIGREVNVRRKNGSVFPAELTVSEMIVWGESMFTGMLRDATARNEAQHAVKTAALLEQLARKIIQVDVSQYTYNELLLYGLHEVAKALDCSLAHIYVWNEQTQYLEPTPHWYVSNPVLFKPFIDVTMKTSFAKNEGLPGRIAELNTTAWIQDVTEDSHFVRGQNVSNKNLAIRGVFAFPVSTHNHIEYVFEYFYQMPLANHLAQPSLSVLGHAISFLLEQKKSRAKLMASNQKLMASNYELEHFASIASHDMQEPLRKIRSYGDMLKRELGDELPEKPLDYLNRMTNATERMQQLIDGLLMYSRVSSQGKPFEPVCLNEVIQLVLEDLEIRIQDVQGRVQLSPLPTLMADPLQMRQLFQNLIANALKFYRDNVPPIVQIEAIPSGEDWVLHVKDNGIGFDEKYKEKIFQVFERLHGRMEYEGTGIGLALCRKIVERHQGQIQVTSQKGEGSNFYMTFPSSCLVSGVPPSSSQNKAASVV